MGYIIIDENLFNWAVWIGVMGGLVSAYCVIWFFLRYRDIMFRKYIREIDDSDRKEIVCTLGNISAEYEFLAKKTNTRLMKSDSNRLMRFIVFLRQRSVE